MRRECWERFPRHRLQRKPLVSDPDMHHGTYVTHVPWCMSGSLLEVAGKRSQHSRRMRNQQFYVSGKRPIAAPRIISTSAISLPIRTGDVQVNDSGIITWNASRITGHPWGESIGHQWTTSQRASNVLHDPWKSCWRNSRVEHVVHSYIHITLL